MNILILLLHNQRWNLIQVCLSSCVGWAELEGDKCRALPQFKLKYRPFIGSYKMYLKNIKLSA